MAQIETGNLMGLSQSFANTSDAVGAGEKNEKGDVMLVQAFFKLIGLNDNAAKHHFGMATKDLPLPTGIFNAATGNAIRKFQFRHINEILNLDGKIHPASYKNRRIAVGRYMTITLLNFMAVDAALLSFENSEYIQILKVLAPGLTFIL